MPFRARLVPRRKAARAGPQAAMPASIGLAAKLLHAGRERIARQLHGLRNHDLLAVAAAGLVILDHPLLQAELLGRLLLLQAEGLAPGLELRGTHAAILLAHSVRRIPRAIGGTKSSGGAASQSRGCSLPREHRITPGPEFP